MPCSGRVIGRVKANYQNQVDMPRNRVGSGREKTRKTRLTTCSTFLPLSGRVHSICSPASSRSRPETREVISPIMTICVVST